MATPSSVLVLGIPWTEEPGGLQSMGSQESGMTELTGHIEGFQSVFDKGVPFRELGGHVPHADNSIHIELIILSLVKYENTTLRRKDTCLNYRKTLRQPWASICETFSEMF